MTGSKSEERNTSVVSHEAQKSAPAAENVLYPQSRHEVRPSPSANDPAVHSMHDEALGTFMYAPGEQSVQADAFPGENEPGWQISHVVAPGAAEIEPCGHSVQWSLALCEKVPAGHV